MHNILIIVFSLIFSVASFSQTNDYSEEFKVIDTPKSIKNNDLYITRMSLVNNCVIFTLKTPTGTGVYKSLAFGIAKEGRVILPQIFKTASIIDKSRNKVLLSFKTNKGRSKYGIYNVEKMDWEIPLVYDMLQPILNSDQFKFLKNNKHGIIDPNGIIIQSDWVQMIKSEANVPLYIVSKITKDGKPLYGVYYETVNNYSIPLQYDKIRYIDNETFLVKKEDKYTLVNYKNEVLFSKWYDKLIYVESEKYFVAKMNGFYGVLNIEGELIIDIEYKSISTNYNKYLITENREGKFGALNRNLDIIIPFEYDKITPFFGGELFKVSKGNKYGLIKFERDYSIKTILPCEFNSNSIYSYNSNLAIARKGNKYTLLNKFGEILNTTIEYYELESLNSESQKDYFTVKNKKDKCGIIDMYGKLIVDFKFDAVEFINEYNKAIVIVDGKYGVFNLLNKEFVVKPIYDLVVVTDFGFYAKKKNQFFKLTTAIKEVEVINATQEVEE